MNTKLTNILLILLLVFNVAFIGKWWMGHRKMHHPPRKEEPTETTTLMHDRTKGGVFLVKALGLDTLQQKKLDILMQAHFNFLDKNMSAYTRNQNNLFNALKNTIDTANVSRYADSMGMLKVAMEKELFTHLSGIKSICNSGQQKQFDALIDNMSMEFVKHHDFHNNNTKENQDSL